MKRSVRCNWRGARLAAAATALALGTLTAKAQEPGPADFPPLPETAVDVVRSVLARTFPDVNREAVVACMQEEFPDAMAEFRRDSVRHYSDAVSRLTHAAGDAVRLLEARERDPELYTKMLKLRRLERQAAQLAAECREAAEAAREESLRKLQATLGEAFRLKQELMQSDVAALERDVNELKALIAKREAREREIVARRLAEIVAGSAHLEW
jgi:hypothetical protein